VPFCAFKNRLDMRENQVFPESVPKILV